VHVSNSFTGATDCDEYAGAVFLDLVKAFDYVEQSILLQNLTCYGFSHSVHALVVKKLELSNLHIKVVYHAKYLLKWGFLKGRF